MWFQKREDFQHTSVKISKWPGGQGSCRKRLKLWFWRLLLSLITLVLFPHGQSKEIAHRNFLRSSLEKYLLLRSTLGASPLLWYEWSSGVSKQHMWLGSMVSSRGINNLRLPASFPPCLFPSVSAPKNPGIWQAASASEGESMSGAMNTQVIYARNCKKN